MKTLALTNAFHPDLYNIFAPHIITVPPLRTRLLDAATYIYHMLANTRGETILEISDKAYSLLFNYDYPGNMKELRTMLREAMQSAAVFGKSGFTASIRRHIRNSQSSAILGKTRQMDDSPAAPMAAKTADDHLAIDEKALADSLKDLPMKLKPTVKKGIMGFLTVCKNSPFHPRDLKNYLTVYGFVNCISSKTIGQYLKKLQENKLIEHVGGQSNQSSYRLSPRFMASSSDV